MTFDKILIPLDGSRFSEAALPKAVELLGARPGATLILLRAVRAKTFPGVDPVDAQVEVTREAADYLETVAARLRAEGVSGVRTSVRYGAAAPAILEAARIERPDLIMMSTHGRSGIGRMIVGSVAESVLRATRTPVFLIRAEGMPAEAPVQWAAGPLGDEDWPPVRERAGSAQPHAARPLRRQPIPRSFRGYAD